MPKHKITILTVNCKRCGKELSTTSRSIHGLDKLKKQYGYICQDCSTPEEKQEMIEAIGMGING